MYSLFWISTVCSDLSVPTLREFLELLQYYLFEIDEISQEALGTNGITITFIRSGKPGK